MRDILLNILFVLFGNTRSRTFNIPYLFGATTQNHETRKKRWNRALIRLYKDKDLLDFLYYQSEVDKENVFRKKKMADLSRGARVRTLFLVYSARRAYEESLRGKNLSGQAKADHDKEVSKLSKAYRETVDMEN